MNRRVQSLIVLSMLVALAGCITMPRQPGLKDALITPSDLKPGDTAIITVKVDDRHGVVHHVEGIVLEDPSIKLKLRDDGKDPDKTADDQIWTLKVDVPFQAPTGSFALQLTAYRADGTVVPVRDAEGRTVPLAAYVDVVIANP
ncbi:MAG: hypothetical protein GWP08_18305 [Nitrospiraceae bacterium]|nr:hypothetical protein [Nitrospiraceae bacterium]